MHAGFVLKYVVMPSPCVAMRFYSLPYVVMGYNCLQGVTMGNNG